MHREGLEQLRLDRTDWLKLLGVAIAPAVPLVVSFWVWSIKLESRLTTMEINGADQKEEITKVESRAIDRLTNAIQAVTNNIDKVDSKTDRLMAIDSRLSALETQVEANRERISEMSKSP